MTVKIRSYNEILGELARKVVADTQIDDIRPGSVIMTLLEAIAHSDFENSASAVSALDLFNIDAIKDTDLDNRASEFGLVRRPAIRSTGLVTITDTTIQKKSSTLYQLKPAPVRGGQVVYVSNAAGWSGSGSIYIGRGTVNYEGPISYTSIDFLGSYYQINLASALDKDHLLSESVIDSQGTADRVVSAGTSVAIPPNNLTAGVVYQTIRDAIVPSGETSVSDVEIICTSAGVIGNAGINTIISFLSTPFTGASVTNLQPIINGKDIETDSELRLRIKNIANNLARGTKDSVLASVIGVSDADDNKQVASAVISEPTVSSEPAILYVDDGTGFQPSYTGQPIDLLISNATGKEQFLQLSNYPIPRPQIVNTVQGPFQLFDGAALFVQVDDEEEVVYFYKSHFKNINAATMSEIVVAINSQSQIFKCRMTSNSTRLLLYPVNYFAEKMIVPTPRTTSEAAIYANRILKFPNTEASFIRLYINSDLLNQTESAATIYSEIYSSWNIGTSGNLIIEVDGTPAQDRTFTLTDFGTTSFSTLNINDWVEQFNDKYAGITASATAGGKLKIVSNKSGSQSSINVVGGTYFNKMFGEVDTYAEGRTSDFKINRQNGNIKLLRQLQQGDIVSAGSPDTKGKSVSYEISGGTMNLSRDSFGRLSEIIVVPDASYVTIRNVKAAVGSTIELHDMGSNTMRIISSIAATFSSCLPDDYLFLVNRNHIDGSGTEDWLDIKDCGLFKITSKGSHLSPGVDTYVEVKNVGMIALGASKQYSVQDGSDIQAFSCDVYPQYWTGNMLSLPINATVEQIAESISEKLIGAKASVFRTNYVKITSTDESNGSISIPVVSGNAKNLFEVTGRQVGNLSHVANQTQIDTAVKIFKRTWPTQIGTYNERFIYSDVNSSIQASVNPGIEGSDSYGEIIKSSALVSSALPSDVVFITDGANKRDSSTIKEIVGNDIIGTQFDKPTTLLDYSADEAKATLAHSMSINANDSIVVILDGDSVNKTIDTSLSRIGRVNSGSTLTHYPSNKTFSGDDIENEAGTTFSTLQFWDKDTTGTDFKDYAIKMRARNWYATGGVGSGGGQMLVRADEFGINGEKIKFQIEYPSSPDQTATTTYSVTPDKTLFSYIFGSGPEYSITAAPSQQFFVTDVGAGVVRLEFQPSIPVISFASVAAGDIINIGALSGVNIQNRGTFRITAVDDVLKHLEIYNPSAVLSSSIGSAEEYEIETIADYQGLPQLLQLTATNGAALDGTYFLLEDSIGLIKFWYDLTGSTSEPSVPGVSRSYRIDSVIVADTAPTVALKTASFIQSVSDFICTFSGSNIFCENEENGFGSGASAGTTGFVLTIVQAAIAPASLKGKYFLIHDISGSVKVWFDVDLSGASEPAIIANKSIKVNLSGNDSASIVASKVASAIAPQIDASVSVLSNVITVVNSTAGSRINPSSATSGFTITVTVQGQDSTPEIVNNTSLLKIYPLLGKEVNEIVSTVNQSAILKCVAVGDDTLEIGKATRDDVYSIGGSVVASLGYDHNPDQSLQKHDHISLFDSENWVLKFENSDPNFTLKKPFLLAEAAPDIYKMDTCPREETSDVGELFALVPTTLENLRHHLGNTALSQISIVSDVEISSDHSKIQIKSKEFGSKGAVEVTGGPANNSTFFIRSEPSIAETAGESYIETSILSTPETLSVGDIVKVENEFGVSRRDVLLNSDTIDVVKVTDTYASYQYNHKDLNTSPYTRVTVSDVSVSYGKSAGAVWRWTLSDSGIYVQISDTNNGAAPVSPQTFKEDGLSASDSLKVDSSVAGSSIAGSVIEATGLKAKFLSALPHNLETGDSVKIIGSVNFNGVYTVTVIDPNRFTFDSASVVTEAGVVVYTSQLFSLTVFQAPTQGDFYYFSNSGLVPSDGKKFVVWTSVDGNLTPPSWLAANPSLYDYEIMVSVNSTDSDNQIASAVYLALLNDVDFMARFSVSTTLPASFELAQKGDIIVAGGALASGWKNTNTTQEYGSGQIAGFPIVNKNTLLKYVDVVNPNGVAMSNIAISNGTFGVAPAPIIKWNLSHSCNLEISSIVVSGGIALVSTVSKHYFNVGDSFVLTDSQVVPLSSTVAQIISYNQLTFATATLDGSYTNGYIIKSGKSPTKYTIQKLGPSDYYRLEAVEGDSPRFIDSGVAVDDLMVIKGDTFDSQNAGEFRVLGIENNRIIFKNSKAKEEKDTIVNFNNLSIKVNWTTNSDYISGTAGAFKNLTIGTWVKKQEDSDTYYCQVQELQDSLGSPTTADLAVKVLLGTTYTGLTASALGVSFDQENSVGTGLLLRNFDDISFYEGDCVRIADTLSISPFIDDNWFDPLNDGNYTISEIGFTSSFKPYIKVENPSGVTELGVKISANPAGFYITENSENKYETYKQIVNIALDPNNADTRIVHLHPADRMEKMSLTNRTSLKTVNKIGFSTNVAVGIDGYLYNTGLLRTVQRIVDGYEPNADQYPGKKAIGGIIEILPPLIKKVSVSINVTTKEGVNLNEITNEIKSTIINYINTLSVGDDVILSQIVVDVMEVRGVQAVTMVSPVPTTERIVVGYDEKAFIESQDISVS
jgi:uncharacterized phage protein gp47/JayE